MVGTPTAWVKSEAPRGPLHTGALPLTLTLISAQIRPLRDQQFSPCLPGGCEGL